MIPGDMQSLHNLSKKSYLQYISLFPITQTPQFRSYTTIILTLIAVIGFSIFAISPTINTIIELRKQLEDRQFANEALVNKIEALSSLQSAYGTMGSTLERIDDTLPTTPDAPDLFAKIQTLAATYNVVLIDLDSDTVPLTKKPDAKKPSSFLISMTVGGTYDQTTAFLDSLSTINRLLTIESISVSRTSQGETSLETTIQARAYFHPETL